MKNFRVVLTILILNCLVQMLPAQARRRIAVLPADHISSNGYDEAGQRRLMLETKVVDAIMSKLANDPSLEVLDRTQTQALESEQNNKLNDRFDANEAAKLGKLQGVNVMIFVHIDDYAANALEEHKDNFLYTKVTVRGVLHLSVVTKAIAVDTGSLLNAPTATIEKNLTIHESKEAVAANHVSTPVRDVSQGNRAELLKLQDQAIDESATDLATKLTVTLKSYASVSKPAGQPKVVGTDEGRVMINRGTSAGMKVGDKFQVIRMVDTGFKDPDSGQPVIRKKKICSLVLSEVEDSLGYGPCTGEVSLGGDLLIGDGK
jgi:hypothetical protein